MTGEASAQQIVAAKERVLDAAEAYVDAIAQIDHATNVAFTSREERKPVVDAYHRALDGLVAAVHAIRSMKVPVDD